MRINEYNSLEEFRTEYATGRAFSWESADGIRHYMGIEFMYKGVYYRVCREPLNEDELPILGDGRKGHYDVMIYHINANESFSSDKIETIGWYADIDDVLENCIIGGRKFRDVIMDDDTQIMSKD